MLGLTFTRPAPTATDSVTGNRPNVAMPLFHIERNFAERLELDTDAVREITRVNDDVGVKWLYS